MELGLIHPVDISNWMSDGQGSALSVPGGAISHKTPFGVSIGAVKLVQLTPATITLLLCHDEMTPLEYQQHPTPHNHHDCATTAAENSSSRWNRRICVHMSKYPLREWTGKTAHG